MSKRRILHRACLAASLVSALHGTADAATETRAIADFDAVTFTAAGELRIDQGPSESLSIEAEPAVLRKITAEVRERRLVIGFAPGRVETQLPIRFTLRVRTLNGFESRAAGTIHIGPLRADALALNLGGGGSIALARLDDAKRLDVRITGAGTVAIEGGSALTQRLVITGMGSYAAPRLQSARAEVVIEGQGEARLAARDALAVRITGVGDVRYRGEPVVSRSVSGVGTIEKDMKD